MWGHFSEPRPCPAEINFPPPGPGGAAEQKIDKSPVGEEKFIKKYKVTGEPHIATWECAQFVNNRAH